MAPKEEKTVGESASDFDLDENLVHLGVKGFYPTGIYLIISFFVLFTPMQYMSTHISSFPTEHRCKLPADLLANLTASDESLSASQVSLQDLIPKKLVDGVETFESCERFEGLDGFDSGLKLNG